MRYSDVTAAKNGMTLEEISTPKLIANMYLDYVELQEAPPFHAYGGSEIKAEFSGAGSARSVTDAPGRSFFRRRPPLPGDAPVRFDKGRPIPYNGRKAP